MKIRITKPEFMEQMLRIGGWYRQEHIAAHVSTSWDKLTSGADRATLYIHSANQAHNCYEASISPDSSYFMWLPVNRDLIEV